MGHIVPAIEDLGIAPFRTAAVLSQMTVASIPSRLIAGFVADRVKKRKVIIGFALLIAISMLWLSWADQMGECYLFAVMFGVAYGGIDPPLAALVGDVFWIIESRSGDGRSNGQLGDRLCCWSLHRRPFFRFHRYIPIGFSFRRANHPINGNLCAGVGETNAVSVKNPALNLSIETYLTQYLFQYLNLLPVIYYYLLIIDLDFFAILSYG